MGLRAAGEEGYHPCPLQHDPGSQTICWRNVELSISSLRIVGDDQQGPFMSVPTAMWELHHESLRISIAYTLFLLSRAAVSGCQIIFLGHNDFTDCMHLTNSKFEHALIDHRCRGPQERNYHIFYQLCTAFSKAPGRHIARRFIYVDPQW